MPRKKKVAKRKYIKIKKHPYIYEYETDLGTRYRVRFTYYDTEHKRREFTKNGFQTRQDAEVILRRAQTAIDKDGSDTLSRRRITLGQYYEQTKKRAVEIGKWRPNTVQQKDVYWKSHVQKQWGNVPMADITRQKYQDWIDDLVKRNYAYSTIKSINSIVQLVMNRAEVNDVITKNRLRSITIEGAKHAKPAVLEPADYEKFVETAKKVLNEYWMTMVYLLSLGARREEVLGLQYSSFKFFKQNDEEFCEITYRVGRNRVETQGGGLKNDSSYRTNYVNGDLVQMIKYSIQYSKNICTRTHRVLTDNGFLFLNEDTGMPVYIQYPNQIFKRVEAACGIHVYPHLLRHYFATMARSLNLPPTDVMHWLGHSSIDMTNSYTRPTQQGSLKVINGMEDVLFNGHEKNGGKP